MRIIKKCVFLLLVAVSVDVSAQVNGGRNVDEQRKLFPNIFFSAALAQERTREASKPYWVPTQAEAEAAAPISLDERSLFLNNDILAYYGHPASVNMGILGRYTIEELDSQLTKLAAEYKAAGGKNIIKAFYIIYGTVWPEGEIGIINNDTLMKYINYAQKNNMLVFIDHQIGKYDPLTAIKRMLPYLKYPNVHLALDPEWRTTRPMKEIGTVSGAEINQVQRTMEEYMIANKISGERMLVIHQFKPWMVSERGAIKGNFSKVRVVHCADGFGTPSQKREAYKANAFEDYYTAEKPVKLTPNLPLKSFKLFYNLNIPYAGYDKPLLTPKEVYALTPRPYLIMYQ